eukprot:9368140-Pyramimonas_sp.AAC.1
MRGASVRGPIVRGAIVEGANHEGANVAEQTTRARCAVCYAQYAGAINVWCDSMEVCGYHSANMVKGYGP